LSQGHITKALGQQNIMNIFEFGNQRLISGLTRNKEYLGGLTPQQLIDIQQAIERNANPAFSPQAQAKALDDIHKAIDDIRGG
jgi:hypothetical protein